MKNISTLDPRLQSKSACLNETAGLWRVMFPNEKFEYSIYGSTKTKYTQVSNYDLLAAAGRQREFYNNVSSPHYMEVDFLKEAIERSAVPP